MSKETLNLMMSLNQKELETQIGLQCAPLLTGVKISNLLTADRKFRSDIIRLFQKTAVSCYLLYESDQKVTFLLYIKEQLIQYLDKEDVRRLMEKFGYYHGSGEPIPLGSFLRQVSVRYRAHMEKKAGFPHEIGLMLGYPAEDVIGFIENNGQNCLYIGYWKVYSKPAERRRIFDGYNRAREQVIRMISGGMNIRNILERYQLHSYKSIAI